MNFWILHDDLEQFKPAAHCGINQPPEFQRVALWTDTAKDGILENTLYILSLNAFQAIRHTIPAACSFLIAGCKESFDSYNLPNWWIQVEEESTLVVYNEALKSWLSYEQWISKMMRAVLNEPKMEKATYSSVLDISMEKLHNPIILFDESSFILHIAGRIPKRMEHTIWENTMQFQHYSMDELPAPARAKIYQHLKQGTNTIKFRDPNPNHIGNIAITPLREQGVAIAVLGSTDIYAELSEGQLALINAVADILQTGYINMYPFHSHKHIPDEYIQNLVDGISVDSTILNYYTNKSFWKKENGYTVLALSPTDTESLSHFQISQIKSQLNQIFPEAMIGYHENKMVVISNQCMENLLDLIKTDAFMNSMNSNDMICGIGQTVYDYSDLHISWKEAKLVIQYQASHKESVPNTFVNLYEAILLDQIHGSLRGAIMCHTRLYSLWRSEKISREQLKLLEIYLLNGRNVVSTSKKLYAHRNTLRYRLEKLEELLCVSFENLDEREYFMLLLSCKLLQSM